MNGATILLLLGCGVLVNAAIPLSRSQNINMNQNTNILEDSPTSSEDVEKWNPIENPDETLDALRLINGNSLLASRAFAAGEAAKEIMDKMAVECNEKATAAVVEAVINILADRSARNNRRNNNYNSNTNTNIFGSGRDYERDERDSQDSRDSRDSRDLQDLRDSRDSRDSRDLQDLRDSRDSRDLINENDANQGSLNELIEMIKNKHPELFDLALESARGYVIGPLVHPKISRTRPSEASETSKHSEEVMLDELLKAITGNEKTVSVIDLPSNEALPHEESPRLDISELSKRRHSHSIGMNNRLFRRRNPYPSAEYEAPYVRPSPSHGHANSNTNSNYNSYRRNVNSNSNYNTNKYRRNMNSNSNNNNNKTTKKDSKVFPRSPPLRNY